MRTYPATPKQIGQLISDLNPRDALIMLIMVETGLRVSDAISLQRESMGRRMTVTEQKTGKRRRISLSASLYAHLKRWVSLYPDDGTGRIVAVDRSTVYRNLHAAALARGWPHISAHSMRKSYAHTYCQKHGIKATQRMLNHKNLETTLLYLVDPEILEVS